MLRSRARLSLETNKRRERSESNDLFGVRSRKDSPNRSCRNSESRSRDLVDGFVELVSRRGDEDTGEGTDHLAKRKGGDDASEGSPGRAREREIQREDRPVRRTEI